MWCLDTYALFEIHNGNEKFVEYLDETAVIPETTLAEFYGLLYKRYNEKTAEYWYKKFSFLSRSVGLLNFIKAIKYRIDHTKEDLSFHDCVGYIYAQENNLKFITADKAFKERPNVEFVTT